MALHSRPPQAEVGESAATEAHLGGRASCPDPLVPYRQIGRRETRERRGFYRRLSTRASYPDPQACVRYPHNSNCSVERLSAATPTRPHQP